MSFLYHEQALCQLCIKGRIHCVGWGHAYTKVDLLMNFCPQTPYFVVCNTYVV